jgi:hypothetical protein
MKDFLSILAEKELDKIILEEYREFYPLLEKGNNDEDDEKYTNPFSRMFSFPTRAIRYRKAKNVMVKYSKKILSRVEEIIRKFEEELDKSIPQIQKKGKDLVDQLNIAKKTDDDIEVRSLVNQQKKFKTEVETNQDARVQHLNQSIDNLIGAYTTGIHKRIDEPGYVLKVELSDKGKADLKFLWEEYVSKIKQQTYEKLIKIINNKHIKGLEKMLGRLEVEIEEAEDRRYKSRRSRDEIVRSEKKDVEKRLEAPKSDFDKLIVYLDKKLERFGDGIEDQYKVAIDEGGELEVYDITFSFELEEETLEVTYYKEETETPVRREKIKNKDDVDHIIEDIEATKSIEASDKEERGEEKISRALSSKLEILLKNPSRDTRKKVGEEIIDSWRKDPNGFADKMMEVLLKNSDIYKEKIKAVERGISNPALIDLLIQLRDDLEMEEKIDPKKVFNKYNDLFSKMDDMLVDQAKARKLTEKDWKLMVYDIILAGGNNMLPAINSFVKTEGIPKEKKIAALSQMKRVMKLIKYSAEKNPEGKTANTISTIKKYLGSKAIDEILNESFVSFKTYKI